MMWWNNAGWAAGSWLAMAVMMVLLTPLAVWLVWRDRTAPPSPQEQSAPDDPDRMLAERFALGEMDDAEFTRSRSVLHPPS